MAKMGMEVIAQSDGVGIGCNFLDSIHNISILLLGIIVQSTQETFQQHNFPVLGIFVVGQISSICKSLVTLVTGQGSLFSTASLVSAFLYPLHPAAVLLVTFNAFMWLNAHMDINMVFIYCFLTIHFSTVWIQTFISVWSFNSMLVNHMPVRGDFC